MFAFYEVLLSSGIEHVFNKSELFVWEKNALQDKAVVAKKYVCASGKANIMSAATCYSFT